jgi:hypothetical protein
MMRRRNLLKAAAAFGAAAFVRPAQALAPDEAPPLQRWRTLEIRTQAKLPWTQATARVWVPVPSLVDDDWVIPGRTIISGNASSAELVAGRVGMVAAVWTNAAEPPTLEVVSQVRTRARIVGAAHGWVPLDLAACSVRAGERRLLGPGDGPDVWIPLIGGRPVTLPGSKAAPVGRFIYPQAETAAGLLDCLDPSDFRHTTAVREVLA